MATNTKTSSELKGGNQPLYQPWDDVSGRPQNDRPQSSTITNGSNLASYDNSLDNGSSDRLNRNQSAVNALRAAEHNAISKNREEPSLYTGSGRNNDNQVKVGKEKRGLGAIITIVIILGGLGAFLGTSNSLLVPALSSILTTSTQTSYTSYVYRTKYITNSMLKGTGADAINTTWTGKVKYSKIPNYMKKRLAKYDIEVTGSGKNTMLHWKGEEIDADRFITMYNENVEFRDAYTKAKRGRVANFFDDAADRLFKKLGLSRNWRANLKDTGDADTDAENLHKTMSSKFENDGNSVAKANSNYKEERVEQQEILDADNKGTGEYHDVTVEDATHADSSASASGGKTADMDTATSNAKSFLSSAANTVASIGSAVCTLSKVANMIAITVAANEIYQSIMYYNGQMEGPSKAMAGYGMESGINSQMNDMTTTVTTSVPNYNEMEINLSNTNNNNYADGNVPTEQVTGSQLEAPILQAILAGSPIPVSEASNYSLERSLKKIGNAFLFTSTGIAICGAVDVFSSVVSIASIFAGGIPSFVGNFIVKTISTAAITITATTVLGFLIPSIAKSLFSNIYDTATGVVAGQLLAQGAGASGSKEGQANSGQGPASKEATNAYNRVTNQVLALEAEQDRYTHSPFDITNSNTFFGSIAYSLLPTITSSSTTKLSSFLHSTTTSLSSLINQNVHAEGEGSSYMTTYGECPMLDNIGAVGDSFCSSISVTDVTTLELEPGSAGWDEYEEVISDSMEAGTCDENGDNCTIKPDSDLARYISYCANRDSPFGVADQNTLNELQGPTNSGFLSVVSGIGELTDAVNALKDMNPDHLEWATGQKCVNTNTGVTAADSSDYKNNDFWSTKGKYYQRYIEDQRILEQMGAYEGSKNPVTAYEEAYEKQYLENHPEANTYIGYLSRISGLTPENTETMLAFVYYYNYIDQYDPTLRIAMTGDTSEIKDGEQVSTEIANSIIRFNNDKYIEDPIETNTTERKYVAYYDIRNRSYAV